MITLFPVFIRSSVILRKLTFWFRLCLLFLFNQVHYANRTFARFCARYVWMHAARVNGSCLLATPSVHDQLRIAFWTIARVNTNDIRMNGTCIAFCYFGFHLFLLWERKFHPTFRARAWLVACYIRVHGTTVSIENRVLKRIFFTCFCLGKCACWKCHQCYNKKK